MMKDLNLHHQHLNALSCTLIEDLHILIHSYTHLHTRIHPCTLLRTLVQSYTVVYSLPLVFMLSPGPCAVTPLACVSELPGGAETGHPPTPRSWAPAGPGCARPLSGPGRAIVRAIAGATSARPPSARARTGGILLSCFCAPPQHT